MTEDFIRRRIKEDLEQKTVSHIHTRFPPEPNGYLHIGHAKSICLNFGIAAEISQEGKYRALCNLRFDDTNPEKEETEYIDSIKQDVQWLGWTWDEKECYASDYFQQLYKYALVLIDKGLAYVDHSSPEEIRAMRGTLTEPGTASQYRERSVEENRRIFEAMRAGKNDYRSCVLRAKIDMTHPNMVMRDPVIYRVRNVFHHRTKDEWCVYPMYDFAHSLSDAIEKITHSLCTIEFEIHRPLYEWLIQAVDIEKPHPVQIEFARLNISYTVLSKRKMKMLVDHKVVDGWDDPRMPTIAGLRRRGYTPSAIKAFCDEIGLTKTNAVQDIARLEEALRTELNQTSTRIMTIIDPIKLVIENYPEGKTEFFDADNNPIAEGAGTHPIPFSGELYIEREDVMEDPPRSYNRLAMGREVRLKYAYYVQCKEIIKDKDGKIVEVRATYDPETRGGGSPDGRKVKGTIHWVSCTDAVDIEAHLLGSLFSEPNPEQHGEDFLRCVNPNSLTKMPCAKAEPYLHELHKNAVQADAKPPRALQFLRKGYFIYDVKKSADAGTPVYNLTVSLKDSWKRDKSKL